MSICAPLGNMSNMQDISYACNLPGSSVKCSGGGFLKQWEGASGQPNPSCKVSGCQNSATDGAHVTVHGQPGAFVVPMCHPHNMQRDACYNMKPGTLGNPANCKL